MAGADDESCDFYAVLGLKKECTAVDLKNAYKKLALKWHPDRCSASGNSKYVEEAKKKFQAIQQAYSVLSDGNKRFLYDVGVYDCNDDNDDNGMGDFLSEMATMMTQNQPNENRNESFEDLQELFEEMFESDIEFFCSSSRSATPSSCSPSSSKTYCSEKYSISNKRNSSEMSAGSLRNEAIKFDGFCVGVECREIIKAVRDAEERIQRESVGSSEKLSG